MGFWVQLAIAVFLQVVSMVLAPKQKGPAPPSLEDFKSPTASADREIPMFWGEFTFRDPNCLWFGEKSVRTYEA